MHLSMRFEIIVGRRIALQFGFWAELIGQTNGMGIAVEPVVCQHSEDIFVVLKFFALDRDNNLIISRWTIFQSILEIRQAKLAGAVG
jgi:hypothetical protein